ncbi:hypothetical protein [Shimia abyssi]|uniref:Uncharacterized protein n=1 Tax=Shimia abyssi TaxID=1662395 RepID=A0A2P8FDH0_9RHOB|nr:hypothetical protein [Shimia abyssi]PSL19761.1 hypothetical protein CLV88_105184 [Shimia abyssi]
MLKTIEHLTSVIRVTLTKEDQGLVLSKGRLTGCWVQVNTGLNGVLSRLRFFI